MKNYKVLACGVFEPYLKTLIEGSQDKIDFVSLDAGLHERPNDLRLMLQAEIDTACQAGTYDAVIVFYGLCGRGTAGLVSHELPVVIPRAHDCITFFLGSHEAYLKQFHANPGTFYHTLGWIDKKINPRHKGASQIYRDFALGSYDQHPEFADLSAQYGEDNAKHILEFFDSWRKNYSRAAYIDMGFPGEDAYADFTKEVADIFGWKHEVIPGDQELMRAVIAGDWNSDRVFVLPPHSKSVATGDDQILDAVAIDTADRAETTPLSEVLFDEGGNESGPSGIGLGIDAGGTYTDAVVYDLGERKIMAKSKSLTTYHDLLIGIRGALEQLPPEMLPMVQVTSLSTTLATNSVVEGRGHKVGMILLTPFDWVRENIGHEPSIIVPGSVDITGEVIEPLDEEAVVEALRRLIENERCSAIVVAGYATVRNPDQANRVRAIAQEKFEVPVVCAHEVSRRLNMIHAAQTSVVNAKLLPVIRDLIASVHNALADFNVPGKLMVVKGDGTPVDESVARARPVETILSGPAASVSGARILTGLDDALVLDIGGTTTDCAIIENGHVAVSPDGVRVGGQIMSVDAVEISTVGLGGDSRIDFDRDRRITIGPTRNIPLSYIAHQHPSVMDFLCKMDVRRVENAQDATALDVLAIGAPTTLDLTEREKRLLDILANGPLPATTVARRMNLPSHILLPTSRLEAGRVIHRCALTPTDLLHVTGEFSRWSTEAAKRALEIFAAMFGGSPEGVLEVARDAVTKRLFEEIVLRELTYENRKLHDVPEGLSILMDKAYNNDAKGLGVKLTLRRPVVAIGAPAGPLVPLVAEHLDCKIIVPEDADVANAVGAIASEITVREEILIRPGTLSSYVLHGAEERIEFSELDRATEKAAEISKARALKRALESGAVSPRVTVIRNDHIAATADGGSVFLGRKVTAVGSGGAFGGKQ